MKVLLLLKFKYVYRPQFTKQFIISENQIRNLSFGNINIIAMEVEANQTNQEFNLLDNSNQTEYLFGVQIAMGKW